MTGQQQHEIFKNEGNLNRDIWRLMVHRLIKDVRIVFIMFLISKIDYFYVCIIIGAF
jgi:hypothetical protein